MQDPDGYLVELVERHPWPDTDPADGAWLGQYCLNVTDIEQTIAFYERLGLTCTSRTEIPHAHEAILEQPGQGGKLQLAQQHDLGGPLEMGSMWKLYVYTDDVEAAHTAATAGRRPVTGRADAARPVAGHGRLRGRPRRLPGRARATARRRVTAS